MNTVQNNKIIKKYEETYISVCEFRVCCAIKDGQKDEVNTTHCK
jgi:hypothetical protein